MASEAIAEPHQRATQPSLNDEQELTEAIWRVQQDARRDGALVDRLSIHELDRSIEEIVRELWADSRVKAFVPLIALRHARAALGLPEGETAAGP